MTRKGKRQESKDDILEALDDPDIIVISSNGNFRLEEEENEEENIELRSDIDPTDYLHNIFMEMQDYCIKEGLELLDKNTAFVNFIDLWS